jgi:predicted enzyme related to lactoylglutathione lyase
MSEWKPPRFGTPCWVSIAATDVGRGTSLSSPPSTHRSGANIEAAAKFYETVFAFPFKADQAADYPKSEIMMFDFNPDLNLSGGIQKVKGPSAVCQPGGSGVCMFWFVEDVNKSGEIIEKAGGKMRSGIVKEGKNGIYRYFEDTEGTIGGVYQMVESNEGY